MAPLCEGRMCFSLFLFIYFHAQQAHNSASIRRRARARARERIWYLYICVSICVVDRCRRSSLHQPRRPSGSASAGDPRRVCHCTGTGRARRITSIPPLRGLYNIARVSRCENETAGESPRRTWRFPASRLAAAVPRRRGSPALTGWSMRAPRRWQRRRYDGECPFYEKAALRAHTGHTPSRESDDNPAANRS